MSTEDSTPIAPTKRCFCCKNEKPRSEFARQSKHKDGLNSYCIDCRCKDPERQRRRLKEQETGLRFCKLCQTWKTPAEFHLRLRTGSMPDNRCKVCRHRPLPATVKKQQERESNSRRCTICGVDKPFDAFYTSKAGSTLRKCKECYIKLTSAYAKAHPEIYLKACRKYQKANPEVGRAIVRRRKIRRMGAPGSHTLTEWKALKRKYGFRCLMCGLREPLIKLTVDHVIPISLGGSDDISNVQPLCAPCNASKGTKTIDLRP